MRFKRRKKLGKEKVCTKGIEGSVDSEGREKEK